MKKLISLTILLFVLIQTSCVSVYAADSAMPYYPEGFDGWRVMPIRSQQEYEQGKIGGEAEQHNHGIARSLYNPDVIYLSHDIGGAWRSTNAGTSWQKTIGKGLWLPFGQSIEVDPVNPNIVFIIVQKSYDYKTSDSLEGLYRSTDGGDNFEHVLSTAEESFRAYTHNIAYDLTTVDQPAGKPASRWYAAFFKNGLYRSEDGGSTWAKASDLSTHTTIYAVQTHPSDGQTVYLASNLGFFKSASRGASLQKTGNLPSGEVSSIAINPQNPSTIYVTVKGTGLYRSLDAGQTFSLLKSFDAWMVFLNYGYPDTLYLVGNSANTITTHDVGTTWITNMCTQPAPGLARDAPTCGRGWKGMIAGGATGIVPNPLDPNEAVAFSRGTIWKTTDGGQIFKDSSTLWTGFAWGWAMGGTAFDTADPNRFAFFLCDVTMVLTETGGNYFEQKGADEAWKWKDQGKIDWVNMNAGAFQQGTKTIVGSVGDYFARLLARSTDNGGTFTISDESVKENHYFVAFHPNDPNIVYAGSARSTNGGTTFQHISYLVTNKALMVGMCNSNPDIVYALSRDNKTIYRSDDRAVNWRVYVTPGWNLNRHDSLPTFAADPFNCDKIYTVASNGDLASYDGTAWKSLGVLPLANTPSGLANFVRNVTLDPKREGIIYASMFAAGVENIFRSTDSGNTWEDISYNRSRIDGGLSVNPHTGELFAGSGFGTWVFPPPYQSSNLFYEKKGTIVFSTAGPSTCSSDSQCGSSEKCCGYCKTPFCNTNADCGPGQQCANGGECNALCQNIQCGEGAITTACYCSGSPRTTGYCCSGAYQTIACGQCTSDSQCGTGKKCCVSMGGNNCIAIACTADANCNDNNAATKDTCAIPSSCTAACAHTAITQCINNDGYCAPGCRSTNDNDCLASCGNNIVDANENCGNCPQDVNCAIGKTCYNNNCITPECSSDSNCQANQKCINPGLGNAQCIDCNISCTTDAACNDNNSTTIDKCNEAGSCDSYCTNEPSTCGGNVCITGQICCNNSCVVPACKKATECNDNDKCTTDKCNKAGSCEATCTHTQIPKCGWQNMKWILPSCFPIGSVFDVTITDEQGNPLQGVEITYGTQSVLTNTSGKAELTGEKAQYFITATKDGYNSLSGKKIATTTCNPTYGTTGTTTPTTTGKQQINITILETPYIGKNFTIQITDNNKQPLQGATITYSKQTTNTNPTGTATIQAEKGQYLITATATQGKTTTKILPKTYTETGDQNTSNGGTTTQQPFTIPLDIIALIAIIVAGGIILIRARAQNKRQRKAA